jgi:hypothetical protein
MDYEAAQNLADQIEQEVKSNPDFWTQGAEAQGRRAQRRRDAGRRGAGPHMVLVEAKAAVPVYQDRAQGHKQGRRGVKDTMRGRRDASLS